VTAPGTGLGMSIVKQIVDLSGGRIDIRSEVGKGTEVKLSLPLTNHLGPGIPSPLATIHDIEDPVEALRQRAHGRTVQILGFDGVYEDSELRKASLLSLKESIENYVTEWFGLSIVSNEKRADILISDESAFLSAATDPTNKFRSQLILCSNGARRNIYMSRLQPGQAVEFVSKPCGPHRIAKALLNCLDTENNISTFDLENRVSENPKGPLNRADSSSTLVPAKTAMVTAGNSRLIGDLQSSIGFSPKGADFASGSFSKPKFPNKKVPSQSLLNTLSPNVHTSNQSSIDASSAGTGFSEEASSNAGTADTNPESVPELSATPVPILRKPKMLLVEVCFQDDPTDIHSNKHLTPGQSSQYDAVSHVHEEEWMGI